MTSYIYPILAYLIGSIPFGVILTGLFGKGDIRKLGSGNIGATNVVRTQGKLLGFSVFIFDFLKGFLACRLLRTGTEFGDLAVFAAPVIGHMFPVWLKLKGGKGVATYFGVFAAINPYACFATVFTWAAIFIVVRISAVAGLVSCSTSLLYYYYIQSAWCLDYFNTFWVLLGLVLMIWVKHHKNISQLLEFE